MRYGTPWQGVLLSLTAVEGQAKALEAIMLCIDGLSDQWILSARIQLQDGMNQREWIP